MEKILVLFLLLFFYTQAFTQKKVFNYPFEFEKGFLQRTSLNPSFLDNQALGNFAFVLKDNKKVTYVQVNDKFKIASEFVKQPEETVFDHDIHQYLGGTTNGNSYHFIYKVTDKKLLSPNTITYMEETVDFDAKSVAATKIFEIPKDEELLVSFSDHNRYFTITANKKTSNLQFYEVRAGGESSIKSVHFPIPAGKSKSNNELTEYLSGLKVIKENEEPGLDLSNHKTKLFCYTDNLVFTVNDGDNPTQILSIDLNTFTPTEKFIDHSALIEKESRGKSFVSSFLKDNRLFTLILNKKDIKIATYNADDGTLINKVVLDEDNGMSLLAQTPVDETRMGKHAKEKDVDDLKKVIKDFTKGTEGLTISTNKAGQYIVQAGTYDLVPVPSGGGSSMGHYSGGYERMPGSTSVGSPGSINSVPNYTYNPLMYYIPGNSGYMTTSARYYRTIYFKILLDPRTLKPVHGRVTSSVGEQIKDFMDDEDPRSKGSKQFAIGDRQLYGYYDRDGQTYCIEEIMIRK